jgi:hypothetical protein
MGGCGGGGRDPHFGQRWCRLWSDAKKCPACWLQLLRNICMSTVAVSCSRSGPSCSVYEGKRMAELCLAFSVAGTT